MPGTFDNGWENRDAEPAMARDSTRRNRQFQELSKFQILQYVAEMSEEMSQLAQQAQCAKLAETLRSASFEARDMLPKDMPE